MITIETSYLKSPIILKSVNPGVVLVGNREYSNNVGPNIKVINTNYYLAVIFGDLFTIFWNEGKIIQKLFSKHHYFISEINFEKLNNNNKYM